MGKIIQAVSNITLMDFLARFNDIIRDGAGVAPRKAPEACLADIMSTDLGEALSPKGRNSSVAVAAPCERDLFYEERGVQLLSVEVLQFKCSNPDTDKTLQAIIKETADRLKKKEYQRGENEMAISKLKGEIEQEKLNKDLIEIKKSHLKTEAKIEGEGVAAFIAGISGQENIDALNRRQPKLQKEMRMLKDQLAKAEESGNEIKILELTSKLEDMDIDLNLMESEMKQMHERFQREHVETKTALEIYTMLRKLDSIRLMSAGNAGLYVTPQDVNLTVGQLFPAPKVPGTTAPGQRQ